MDKNQLIEKLKEKGIKMSIDDGACGCCGYTEIKIEIDGQTYEANGRDHKGDTYIDTGDLK